MRRRVDESIPGDGFSLGGSRISISLSTIHEECSFDYFSSQSSFGTVSSFDSAMISAESLCSDCRFDNVVRGAKNKPSKMPSLPPRGARQLARPKEIIFEGLDEMEQQAPDDNNLTTNAKRPKRGGSWDGDYDCSSQGDGAEYTQPLNDDEPDFSYRQRRMSSLTMPDFEYIQPLNDEDSSADSGIEYSRPLNEGHRYSSNRRYEDEMEREEEGKVEEDDSRIGTHRFLQSDLIRHFDDMRLISSPMTSPASSCSSKSRSIAMPTVMVETILSNTDILRSLDDEQSPTGGMA